MLAPHMKRCYEEAQKLPAGVKRSRMTSIINQAWDRDSEGNWVMCESAPVFEEFRRREKSHSLSNTSHGSRGKSFEHPLPVTISNVDHHWCEVATLLFSCNHANPLPLCVFVSFRQASSMRRPNNVAAAILSCKMLWPKER